jgi:hypothetical protein
MEKQKIDPKTRAETHTFARDTTDILHCNLTDKEIKDKVVQISDLVSQKAKAEEGCNELSASLKLKKEEVLRFQSQMNGLARVVADGYEMRTVKCIWKMNIPRSGMKTLVTARDGELVRSEEMLDSDRQMVLDDILRLDRKEKEDEKAGVKA